MVVHFGFFRLGMDGDSDLSMFNKEDGGGGGGGAPEGSKAAKNSDGGAAEVAAAKAGDAEAGKGASPPSQPLSPEFCNSKQNLTP